MKFRDLPRVEIQIIDKSEYFAGIPGTRSALIIGSADKGPVGVPIEISSIEQLVFTFGKPSSPAMLVAYLYLQLAGQPVVFVRSFHTDFLSELTI